MEPEEDELLFVLDGCDLFWNLLVAWENLRFSFAMQQMGVVHQHFKFTTATSDELNLKVLRELFV